MKRVMRLCYTASNSPMHQKWFHSVALFVPATSAATHTLTTSKALRIIKSNQGKIHTRPAHKLPSHEDHQRLRLKYKNCIEDNSK